MTDLLIKNVHIIDPVNNTNGTGDIFIKNGVFADAESAEGNVEIINGAGMKAAPGLVDLHVHLRDPGQTDKEDILSGCAAAAAGCGCPADRGEMPRAEGFLRESLRYRDPF